MTDTELVLSFEGASSADSNRYAEELERQLLDASPELTVTRERSDGAAMDFGGTLVLVLGTPAVVAAARAIRAYLTRNNQAKILLKTRAGVVVASGLESKDVPAIVDALTKGAHTR